MPQHALRALMLLASYPATKRPFGLHWRTLTVATRIRGGCPAFCLLFGGSSWKMLETWADSWRVVRSSPRSLEAPKTNPHWCYLDPGLRC
ncbi:hypothetical protein JAAARDRAFT_59604 [Jaapia argillacea MUCL 33604]|uniref:Uncharacterized protein n=1 Tax=Jaapia argillacea MUCL 33604 TaxID=933084 RepID=A0A067PP53_9AGAM|nr:hypothetical protein JAAARDRAFT_59604 [Jaapia argillacea MUCL 33604]